MSNNLEEQIRKKLEDQLKQKFEKVKPFARGSTAFIYTAIQKDLRIKRVFKVFKPSIVKKSEEYVNLFKTEVSNLAKLTHENIISILETGNITIKTGRGKGKIEQNIPYYIMEYLEGAEELGNFLRINGGKLDEETILGLFEQILRGLDYIHRSKLFHLDVKEGNIFVGKGNRLKISDFGFAKPAKPEPSSKYIRIRGTSANWPEAVFSRARDYKEGSNPAQAYAEIPKDLFTQMLDIHALGKIFFHSLRRDKIRRKFKEPDLEYLNLMISRMDSNSEIGPKYTSVAEIMNDLRKLGKYFVPVAGIEELSYVPKVGIIRIPELMGVPFTERVKKIVDHPWFQRLRNAKQMGFAYLVYPGAVHTRFEHSLGVYQNAIRYITSLLSDPRTPFFKQVVTEKDILSVLVAALLHDIGQHTFAHSLEEHIMPAPHEFYGPQILNGTMEAFFTALPKPEESFLEILEKEWGISDPSIILYIISKGTKQEETSLPDYIKILSSIVDGPIDADKMDYLDRDSLHCGVAYGRALDQGRFLQALTVDDQNFEGIAFTEKGRICAELFFVSRSHMHAEVYWHHAVRAFSGMLNLAVAEFKRWKKTKKKQLDEFRKAVFTDPEWEVLNFVFKKGPQSTKEIIDLIKRRKPYKRLYVVKQKEMYDRLAEIRPGDDETFRQFSSELAKSISSEFFKGRKRYPPHYFFLDIPKPNKHQLGTVYIIEEENNKPVNFFDKSDLCKGAAQDWHRWVRKIRLFCHPAAYGDFEQLGYDYHRRLDRILERLSLSASRSFKS